MIIRDCCDHGINEGNYGIRGKYDGGVLAESSNDGPGCCRNGFRTVNRTDLNITTHHSREYSG